MADCNVVGASGFVWRFFIGGNAHIPTQPFEIRLECEWIFGAPTPPSGGWIPIPSSHSGRGRPGSIREIPLGNPEAPNVSSGGDSYERCASAAALECELRGLLSRARLQAWPPVAPRRSLTEAAAYRDIWSFPQCGNILSIVWKNRENLFHTVENFSGGGEIKIRISRRGESVVG